MYQNMKRNFLYLYLLLSFIYLEIVFKLVMRLKIFDISLSLVCLSAALFISIICLIIDLFNRLGKNIFTSIILFLFGIYFSIHTCLYNIYKFYFQFSTLAFADQTTAFASDGLKMIVNNALYIFAYFVPFLAFIIFFRKYVTEDRTDIKYSIIITLICLILYLPFALTPNSILRSTFDSNNMIQIVNKNGVISGLVYDVFKSVKGEDTSLQEIEEETIIEEPEVIEYGYNGFDIDYSSLNTISDNKEIIELNNYFNSISPTKKNEYTGFFENKNLILFMAESFNGIAVNPDLTPTLYKLIHNGFEFNNFYTPTNYSTIGGEYCELTGLIPEMSSSPNSLSIFRAGTNDYPMGIGNLFKEKGYTTYAYHNSTYDFQDRNVYLEKLGFDNYNAQGLGLEKLMDISHWPASDVDMIDVTFDDYINDDNFLVFYATVSGHGPYLFDEKENIVAPKYKDILKEYYGDKLGNDQAADYLMAYQAGQIELDRALEKLIDKLDKAGKLNDTVIALVGDHHPYYLTERLSMDDYNRLSTYERDQYIELYRSNFILYNSTMNKVSVDKVGGQLDVIPTIYNLFGLNYDSRLLIGTDLLSNSSSIVIMSDNSWVNDQGKYYAISSTSESNSGTSLADSYVSAINNKINNLYKISKMIMRNNYYKFIYDNK